MYKIVAICGSTRKVSVNKSVLKFIENHLEADVQFLYADQIDQFPFLNQDIPDNETPKIIDDFKTLISESDGVIISSPEYVFSVPGVLKNALEWLVSSTLLSDKPVAVITASSGGETAHESLKRIIRTLSTKVPEETCLLIQGAKAKINDKGIVVHTPTEVELKTIAINFIDLVKREIDFKTN